MSKNRLKESMKGLAIGDAIGRQAFLETSILHHDNLPAKPLEYTDDTRMALALCRVLLTHHEVQPDELAKRFAADFQEEPERGYGAVAYYILHQIASGTPWQEASTSVYGGTGSKGNGAAMRVAPLGAFFADQPNRVLEQAELSALPTHAHPEGIAGAQVLAWTTSVLFNSPNENETRLFASILEGLSGNPLLARLEEARQLGSCSARVAGETLGAGEQILASDTVPLAVWLAVHHRHDFKTAIVQTVEACPSPEADVDTLCAMVGGMVAPLCFDSIPEQWMLAVESYLLP